MAEPGSKSVMGRPYARAAERLRSVGLRPTRQRLALAKLLFDSGMDRHVTAEALHEEAQGAGAKVSLATIYNALHQFTDMGLLREVVVDCGRAYFDTNVGDHHHFFFEDAGHLEDIPAEGVRFAEMPATPEGSSVVGVDVVIRVRSAKS